MIAAVIRWSVANRFLVVLAALVLAGAGALAIRSTPVDALPDLSDVQVVVRTSYPGQAPQIVEDQVTYPVSTAMLSVPGARSVRGYSFFGDSFVYVIFEEGVDLYWARSRVLEYLNQVQSRLPSGATASLGPDATGVGWIYQYFNSPEERKDMRKARAPRTSRELAVRNQFLRRATWWNSWSITRWGVSGLTPLAGKRICVTAANTCWSSPMSSPAR